MTPSDRATVCRWNPAAFILGAIGILACGTAVLPAAESTEPIPVGVAQVDITPDHPVRLNGFGGRRTESEGVTQKIWAKALAFGDTQLGPAVIITTDNLGVPDEITQAIADRLAGKTGLKRERLNITASHSHTAPMLKNVAPTIFGTPIPPEHQANIDRYTREFTDKLEQVALVAIQEIRPSRLSWGVGSVKFAANRRTAGGPVDHDLPVLVVRDLEGKTRAIYFSYACHCVTLSHNKISGDWLGYAMEHVQEKFPGAIALASVGCGADSNPNSGVTGAKFEIASNQGIQIATEVARLMDAPLTAITNRPHTRLTRIELPFAAPRTRAEWETRAKANDAVGHQARVSLARLDQGQTLPTKIEYQVQSWMFGEQLAMVFLPGEVVVDYSLRLKREFDRQRIWVNAYANDAPCYIPSERVLKEGGYEGGDAMIYYDKPQKLAPGLEQKIIDAVRTQIPKTYLAPEGTEGSAPTPPGRALNTLRTKPGLTIELAAAEPLVTSPVAIDWDAAGNLWVCEMFDYPTGLDENWQPGGRVKRLRDTNGDGIYDEAVIFLDGLPFPTGVMAWGRGVLVCAAPDILYAEDTDNDGKADRVEKRFSGFAAENYQARVNSLSLGLDNWIYGANGLLGGVIRGPAGTVDTRGHDFRFRFSGGPMETVNGLTQQGRVRDDWGRWFGCNNGAALNYYPYDARYLRRNPNIPAPPSSVSPPGNFDVGRVYPASRLLERFNDPDAANHITSGCGLGLYRDTLLGSGYYNNTFTCEPVHNLVHRLALHEDGLKLGRRRADDEARSEFLASTDNWFRPVQVRTGPDGALYVVDMYRFLIEHPRWIPAARLAKINVRAGAGMGRIYRLRPASQPLRPIVDLTRLDAAALANALNSPNGTERDRVQVELLSRHDSAAAAGTPLKNLAQTAALPQTRLQALSALDGLGVLAPATLAAALGDPHERVRSEAVRLCESFLSHTNDSDHRQLFSNLLSLTNDPSLLVVRQLAFTLGEWDDPRAGRALGHIARRSLDQAEVRTAVLSSAGRHGADVLTTVMNLDPKTPGAAPWLEPLVATVAASQDESLFNRALLALLPTDSMTAAPSRFFALAHLLNALERRNTSPRDYFQSHSELRPAEPRLAKVLSSASQVATDSAAPPNEREAAIQLLGRASTSEPEIDLLCQFLTGPAPDTLRTAASAGLRRQRSSRVPERLLAGWTQTSPIARQEIIQLLLGRDPWTLRLLDGIKNNTVQPLEISLADRQRLAKNSDVTLRRLAAELLPSQPASTRADVLEKFKPALALAGHEEHGREVFAKNCMSCHALGGMGYAVGPDLAALRAKEPDYWLKNILDPNAVIEPRFVAYAIETRDDRSLSGVIQTETASSLTLVSGNGVTEIIPRSDIKSIRASNLSLMPEGLDQGMNAQDMADLLAFVIPRTPPKRFAGNEPSMITPGPGEALLLPAARAEIIGGSIAFESLFKNIGMWHGSEDHAAWTLQVNQSGPYDVHIDYACAEGSAGNSFRITLGSQSITGQVAGTGPAWSRYAQTKVGSVQLEAGRHRLTFHPNATLRGALMDLRTVALSPPGKTPDWPAPAAAPVAAAPGRDLLLRDPVSIARYLLDPAQPASAREAAIRANPQFAADFIAEMTRDLQPGSPAEYERIPWIWRVAISCGKRNEPLQIKRVLEASLPSQENPLRDWQAVVIGGGIINGLSQRGLWPAQSLKAILADDSFLLKRWDRALDLAAAMSDDSKVPAGTRYDALRMLGMEPWEKRGAQLVRYLSKDANAELQMGAVSALGDLSSPQATAALVAALEYLKGTNRELALDALLRDDLRTKALLDGATARGWKAEALGTNRIAKLRDHPNSTLRARALELVQP